MTSKKNLIAIRIEDNIKDKLDKLANENKCTVSDYVRQILRENIELVEKNKKKLAEYSMEGAMLEIYRNTKYKIADRINSESEKLFYSNMLIEILLKDVKKNKEGELRALGTKQLLDMILIQKNIELCSKNSSEENKKLYEFLQASYNERLIDNLFTSENKYECLTLNKAEEISKEEVDLKNAVVEEINLLATSSEDNIDIQEKIKQVYIENQRELYCLEERKLGKQFEYYLFYEMGTGEYILEEILEINSQLRKCIIKRNETEKFIKKIIKNEISKNYNEWTKKSEKHMKILKLDKSEISNLLAKMDYLELEAEIDFANVLFESEVDAVWL